MNSTTFPFRLGRSKSIFYFFFLALFSVSLTFQSCGSNMVPRDTFSIEQNEIIKNNVISLIKKGGKNYSEMAPQVESLKATINDQIEYERERGEKNMKTVEMWELMMNPDGNLLGGFLSRWENEGKLNGPFIKEVAKVVSSNFDKIIKLEKKKKKP